MNLLKMSLIKMSLRRTLFLFQFPIYSYNSIQCSNRHIKQTCMCLDIYIQFYILIFISTTRIILYYWSVQSQMGSECHSKLNSQIRGFTTFVLDKVLLQWRQSYICCLKEASISLISLLWHSNFLPEIFFQILDPNPRNLHIMIPGLL